MPPDASLGFGAGLVNKCTHWSPNAKPAIIEGSDLVGSNVEGVAPFNGEAFED
jgi:hypothetical protein